MRGRRAEGGEMGHWSLGGKQGIGVWDRERGRVGRGEGREERLN